MAPVHSHDPERKAGSWITLHGHMLNGNEPSTNDATTSIVMLCEDGSDPIYRVKSQSA